MLVWTSRRRLSARWLQLTSVKYPKLAIELIPQSCSASNVRSHVDQATWDRLRRWCYQRAGYTCETCGATDCEMHAHEVWRYDDFGNQVLVRLMALCKKCHEVKHMGRAIMTGRGQHARLHLQRVNGWGGGVRMWGRMRTVTYIVDCFAENEKRGRQRWSLDLNWLYNFDIVVVTGFRRRPTWSEKLEFDFTEVDDEQ